MNKNTKMSILNNNSDIEQISSFMVDTLQQNKSGFNRLHLKNWDITQIGKYSFEIYDFTHDVNFHFHFELFKDSINIINDKRYSRNQKKGNGTQSLQEVIKIFKQVGGKMDKKKINLIFEIQGYENTNPDSVRRLLTRLQFQQTQDTSPEKWIKIIEL